MQDLSSRVYKVGFIIKRVFVVSKALEIEAQSEAGSSGNLSAEGEMPYNNDEENELPFCPFILDQGFLPSCLCCSGEAVAGQLLGLGCLALPAPELRHSGVTGAGSLPCPNPAGAAQGLWDLSQLLWDPFQLLWDPPAQRWAELWAGSGAEAVTGLPCPISSTGLAASVLLASLPSRDCVPPAGRAGLGREEIASGAS